MLYRFTLVGYLSTNGPRSVAWLSILCTLLIFGTIVPLSLGEKGSPCCGILKQVILAPPRGSLIMTVFIPYLSGIDPATIIRIIGDIQKHLLKGRCRRMERSMHVYIERS
ncbi:hypothetical protein BX666DRAFT_1981982 [Dichotomocladium elegans]|nr:hypothetical protein BX666DRAFT_1981982 [Dichotomocladium elegans]